MDGPLECGARVEPDGTRFVLRCARARRVYLMLFENPNDEQPLETLALDPEHHRIEDLWYVHVPGVQHGALYAYRVEIPGGDPTQWILDPAASALAWPAPWGDPRGLTPGRWRHHGAEFPKCVVVDFSRFDWQGDRSPRHRLDDLVVYEAHLRGFTAHPSSRVQHPGTYAGFMEKIPYLVDLGVTAVEFLPLHEFDEMAFFLEARHRRHLRNFWGYDPIAWGAPNSKYAAATTATGALDEFRELVRRLHSAGIEVWLDVVFNHTGEWGVGGPVFHFKALDRDLYYLRRPGTEDFANYTGCGNTVNANEPSVANLIVQVLHRWVQDFHIDGFRFDLAAALTRGPDGMPLRDPPLLAQIAADPVLRDVRLVAEPWDAAGLYQVGNFPGRFWLEWNGRFRDDVRRFWRGDPGFLGALATRLAGSSDLYTGRPHGPLTSVNYVTCHDGFTLADLVRYTRPRNEANGEGGRDGDQINFSFNCGVEGPSGNPAIEALRLRQQKNLLACVLLAQGVPMLLAGDEFGRTQQGNNNVYAQDNPLGWVDWSLLDQNAELHAWVRALIRLRARFRSLRRSRFLTGRGPDGVGPDIAWFGPDGGTPDWHRGRALGFRLSGHPVHTGGHSPEPDLLVLINGAPTPMRFELPAGDWKLELTSMTLAPEVCAHHVVLDPLAIAVWSSREDFTAG
jgi:glycogen operon protein